MRAARTTNVRRIWIARIDIRSLRPRRDGEDAPCCRPSRRTACDRAPQVEAGSGECDSFVRLVARRRVLRLVLFLLSRRNRVGATEPAVQVDVGAAPRAERAELLHPRLAADRAWFGRVGWGCGFVRVCHCQ